MAGDLDRLCELVQRTNQFNTTTIRYSKAQLQEMMASPRYGIYVAHLSDRFGKQGLVLAVVVSRQGDVCTFESFVMSCRAMGFELERLALALTIEAEEDAHTFVGRFVPTERNNPAAELYSAHGFVTAGPEEWILGPGAERPQAPDWFEVQLLQAA
jgi:FkbH-like protein